MDPFKSILVDIDASVAAHPALERAIRLARASGARLTITDVMTVPAYARRYLPADVEDEMVRGRRQQLARIAHAITDVPTEARLLDGRPGTVLIQEVLRSNHDLLMRSHARDVTPSGPQPFGAVDMELLRKCPCPVLLVRQGTVGEHPQIAGAVNASTEEPAERALNARIVEWTLLMAELEGGLPILLQAWAPFAERMVRTTPRRRRSRLMWRMCGSAPPGTWRGWRSHSGVGLPEWRRCIAEGSRRMSFQSSPWRRGSISW
jgi:universal stress protein E